MRCARQRGAEFSIRRRGKGRRDDDFAVAAELGANPPAANATRCQSALAIRATMLVKIPQRLRPRRRALGLLTLPSSRELLASIFLSSADLGMSGETNATSSTIPTVSVVIPTHNEAGTIADVVRQALLHTPGIREVLIVDDGSTDGTSDAAIAAGARVIRLEVNRGKGEALRVGIQEAESELLAFLDGDGQDDPREIPTLLAALGPDVDMVIGSRFLGRFEDGSITFLNRVGTRVLTATLNGLYRASVSDPIAGFRVLRKSALEGCRLKAKRYDIEVDILLALLESGGRVVEIPVKRYPRTYGTTDLASFRDGSRIFWRILSRRAGFA